MASPKNPESDDQSRAKAPGSQQSGRQDPSRVNDPARSTGSSAQSASASGQSSSAKGGNGASSTPAYRSGGSESSKSSSSASSSSSPGRSTPGSSSSKSSSSRSSANEDKSFEALECIVDCLETVVREIPRGAGAQLKSAQDDLRRARDLLSGGSQTDSSSSWKASGASSRPALHATSSDRMSIVEDEDTSSSQRPSDA